MMFRSDVCHHTYSVMITYVRGKEVRIEYWQLVRPRWTARETKMVWAALHDAILTGECNSVTARVFECELEQIDLYSSCCYIMRFTSILKSRYPELPVYDRADGVCVRKWYLAC